MSEAENKLSPETLKEKVQSIATGKNVAAAAGVAAAAIVSAIAVRAVRKRTKQGDEEAIFHLKQGDEGWVLELEGADIPKASFETKEEGLSAARELAHQSAPCELIIYRTDGTEQDRHSYEG